MKHYAIFSKTLLLEDLVAINDEIITDVNIDKGKIKVEITHETAQSLTSKLGQSLQALGLTLPTSDIPTLEDRIKALEDVQLASMDL